MFPRRALGNWIAAADARDEVEVNVRHNVPENCVVDAISPRYSFDCAACATNIDDKSRKEFGVNLAQFLVVVVQCEDAAAWEPSIVVEAERRHFELRDRHPQVEPAHRARVRRGRGFRLHSRPLTRHPVSSR